MWWKSNSPTTQRKMSGGATSYYSSLVGDKSKICDNYNSAACWEERVRLMQHDCLDSLRDAASDVSLRSPTT